MCANTVISRKWSHVFEIGYDTHTHIVHTYAASKAKISKWIVIRVSTSEIHQFKWFFCSVGHHVCSSFVYLRMFGSPDFDCAFVAIFSLQRLPKHLSSNNPSINREKKGKRAVYNKEHRKKNVNTPTHAHFFVVELLLVNLKLNTKWKNMCWLRIWDFVCTFLLLFFFFFGMSSQFVYDMQIQIAGRKVYFPIGRKILCKKTG